MHLDFAVTPRFLMLLDIAVPLRINMHLDFAVTPRLFRH
jgi:hypothetical protein